MHIDIFDAAGVMVEALQPLVECGPGIVIGSWPYLAVGFVHKKVSPSEQQLSMSSVGYAESRFVHLESGDRIGPLFRLLAGSIQSRAQIIQARSI
jgi:hypothetical protein